MHPILAAIRPSQTENGQNLTWYQTVDFVQPHVNIKTIQKMRNLTVCRFNISCGGTRIAYDNL
jgi:hypothetical protein